MTDKPSGAQTPMERVDALLKELRTTEPPKYWYLEVANLARTLASELAAANAEVERVKESIKSGLRETINKEAFRLIEKAAEDAEQRASAAEQQLATVRAEARRKLADCGTDLVHCGWELGAARNAIKNAIAHALDESLKPRNRLQGIIARLRALPDAEPTKETK